MCSFSVMSLNIVFKIKFISCYPSVVRYRDSTALEFIRSRSRSRELSGNVFTPDLNLISFINPFLHSLSDSFRTAFMYLNLYCIKGALAIVCFCFFFFWLRVLDKAEYSAFESTLNSAIVSYRIVSFKQSHSRYFRCPVWKSDLIKKSKHTCKLKHANSILESFEYFCQTASKSILIILNYTVSNLVHFWDSVFTYTPMLITGA